ncbi:Transcriptional regulatory protein-like protein [Emericellopsis cladophorae]|uniref:Transcriptional regulatory protein-like protein n=1 Tax=Emericellopsis cladophorae TaxID=2686198 RepID=A0A9P9XTT6_9HYPO|nr:Transcriptional regulatory protein-like protein [Emericellopsis cladophorae]KAI6777733.1 Transcriptional regulatory protein-like protein [Emericellopsis cladophorae]
MVFPGRFSTGCMRCRQRKVKCDEGKPSCRRCYIYGKECPGYTDQFHFRHELTASSFKKSATTQRRKNSPISTASVKLTNSNKKKVEKDSSTSTSKGSPSSACVPVWSPTTPVATTLSISTDDISLCYFVHRFVTPAGLDGFPGHLTFLPTLYDKHQDDGGVLELATKSVAKMAVYNKFGGDDFRFQSYQAYGKAIRSLQNAIQDETQVMDDKVLAAVLLLCTLKDVSGEGVGDPSEHAAGLYYLLERRGVEQLATRRGVELFLLSLIRLQVYSFLREDDTYSDPGGLTSALGAFDPLIRAMFMMTRVLSLRNTLSKYVPMGILPGQPWKQPVLDINDEGHETVIQECLHALQDFDTWDMEAASYWQNTFQGRTLPTRLGEVGTSMTYCDQQTACTIILIRSARLILVLSLLIYHDLATVPVGNLEAWVQWVPVLQNDLHCTIDDILACVPFALGDVDQDGKPRTMSYDGAGAIIIIQPLRLVTWCIYAKPEQHQIARNILGRINAAIGIRAAVSWHNAALHSDGEQLAEWQPDVCEGKGGWTREVTFVSELS